MTESTTPETTAPETAKERLNSLVAITLAVLAALMGITKVKDDNIVQAMQQAKVNAVDTNRRWLLVLAWLFGALGILMAAAGFLQLKLHPDWLVRLLS